MPNILPGAIWQPINVGSRAARRKGRGLVGHVAVSSSKNLVPGPNADWHLYLPKVGPPIQYIDLDLQCWATSAGNASMVAFESEGGLGTAAQVNAEPWTENQLNWAAHTLRYLHDTEGVPLQVMPDSRPASRGFGTHRLGINPWRVADGEVWSSANGKLCPGDAKHAQRFEIVNRAINRGDDMASVPQNEWDALVANVGAIRYILDPPGGEAQGEVLLLLRALNARDAASIVAAIPADLAQQVADELAARLASA